MRRILQVACPGEGRGEVQRNAVDGRFVKPLAFSGKENA
jgi:hypothetical protein